MAKKLQVLSCFVFSLSLFVFAQVDTVQIEQVREQYTQSKQQLDTAATQVIDGFWRQSIDALMLSKESQEIVAIRDILVAQKGDKETFYTVAYIKAAETHLRSSFDIVNKWTEPERQLLVARNLMILVAEFGRFELADLAIARLNDQDAMVRYWAVQALTGSSLISQLKSDATIDSKKVQGLIDSLGAYIKEQNDPRSLVSISSFAIGMQTLAAQNLLLMMADKRIDAYMKWTVTDEAVDAAILKAIGNLYQTTSSPAAKQELMSRFGQLYACVMQRQMKGKNIPSSSLDQLVTVIAEVEEVVLPKLLSGWTPKFRVSLAKNVSIDKDYEFLFGSGLRQGELVSRLSFTFGKDSSGKPLLVPQTIPAQPEPPAESQP